MLLCAHSAFGQSANPAFGGFTTSESKGNNNIITIVRDSRAIDMGLSVYWADRNVGASSCDSYNSNMYGTYFTYAEAQTWNSSHDYQGWGSYWRTPTYDELNNKLYEQSSVNSSSSKTFYRTNVNTYYLKFENRSTKKFIVIPPAGHQGSASGATVDYSCMLLVSDKNKYFYFARTLNSALMCDFRDNPNYKIPIRPVIDKCTNVTIKVQYPGDNSATVLENNSYPKGTILKAKEIDCYDYEWRIAGGTLNAVKNKDIEITSTNVTYSLVYIIKQYNVTAYSNDQVIGTISPVSKTVNCGESVTLTAKPAVCYKLSRWVDLDDSSIVYEPGNSNDEYSCTTNADGTCTLIIKNVRRAMKVRAEFVLKKSNVTIEANPEEGGLVEFANRTN